MSRSRLIAVLPALVLLLPCQAAMAAGHYRPATRSEARALHGALPHLAPLPRGTRVKYIVSTRDPRLGARCLHYANAGNEGSIFRRPSRRSRHWRYVTGGSAITGTPKMLALHQACMEWLMPTPDVELAHFALRLR